MVVLEHPDYRLSRFAGVRVNKAIQEFDLVIQQNAISTEKTVSMSLVFTSQVEQLRQLASFFIASEVSEVSALIRSEQKGELIVTGSQPIDNSQAFPQKNETPGTSIELCEDDDFEHY